MPGQFQVFLSHAQEDYRLVYRVWSILSCLKVQSYMHELYPDYRQDIPSGIRDVLKDKNRLPSGWEINHAIDAGNVFVFKCLTCGVEMHVSPQTLEIVP
jgi:hypothetical protein